MKITPLEIRQKIFEKKLRGYDKDEVNAFLQTLSQEWERVQDESKELKINLDASRREVEKLREVESSLFKTLKTAEDTGANMIEQANKTAELHLKETQMQADAVLNEAKAKAKALIENAEYQAQKSIDDMEIELRELYQVFKSLEGVKDNLISELRNISNDSLDRVQKLSSKSTSFDLDKVLKRNQVEGTQSKKTETKAPQKVVEEPIQVEKPKVKEKKKDMVSDSSKSFFDEIE